MLGLAGWVAGSAAVSNLLWLSYGVFWNPVLFGRPAFLKLDWPSMAGDLNAGFFTLLLAAGIASAVKVFNEWYEQRQLGEALRQHQLRTELELLKAQLQPAFLFDALRSLQSLAAQQPAAAPAAVLHLAAVLRYTLYESPRDAVPLAGEAAMVRHYVALEKLRLGPHVDVSLSFSGPLDAHTVAPPLLLPLVENAFRYGTGARLECPRVSIDLVAKNNSVTFKVINSQGATEAGAHEGPGLGSLRRRLARLYPGRHELRVVAEPDNFLVALHLRPVPPQRPLPAPGLPQAAPNPPPNA